jgi:hypothetical protein
MAIRRFLAESDKVDDSVCVGDRFPAHQHLVKVTVRLPAAIAMLLTRRAVTADVSQGAYLAGLTEGTPPQVRPADHGDAVSALVQSTQSLAALCVDMNAITRLLRKGLVRDAERYCAEFGALSDSIHAHVLLSARLVTSIQANQRGHRGSSVAPPRHRKSS